jgi:RNA polymerase sigma-70 factor (ECF subfamily)
MSVVAVEQTAQPTFDQLVNETIATWLQFQLDRSAFVRHLQALNVVSAENGAAAHLSDLYLAFACLSGNSAALELFASQYLDRIPQFVCRVTTDRAQVADVRQAVAEKLLTGGAGEQTARLASYAGRGPLSAWVRVVAVRTAIDLVAPVTDPSDASGIGVSLSSLLSAERNVLMERYRPSLERALREAAAALEPHDRTLLRLSLVEGVSTPRLAKMYNVNQATVWRRVDRAKQALLDQVNRLFREWHQMEPTELASLVRDLQNHIDFSLAGLLDGASAPRFE